VIFEPFCTHGWRNNSPSQLLATWGRRSSKKDLEARKRATAATAQKTHAKSVDLEVVATASPGVQAAFGHPAVGVSKVKPQPLKPKRGRPKK
jgi:hypothetical protein